MPVQFKIIPWLLFTAVIASCYGMTSKKNTDSKMEMKGKMAIVELFTSEGCSSCPPADELLGKINAGNADVYVLSYHVDYWDRLGWKDPFSQAAFTNRQQEYAAHFNLESTYTPEVVVNGSEEFVGSDAQRLKTALAGSNVNGLEIKISRTDLSTLKLRPGIDFSSNQLLQVALVQPAAETMVKRGENSGRTLHHVNVVHQLTTVTSSGEQEIKIPVSLQKMGFKVIVFLQNKKDYSISSATSVTVPVL